jgi:hypothetical protein
MAEKEKPVVPGAAKVEAIKTAAVKVNVDMRKDAEEKQLAATTPVKWSLPAFLDIGTIQDIYGSLRDGDMWSAFTRSISLINKFVNPDGKLRALPPQSFTLADANEYERSINLLSAQLDAIEANAEEGQTVSPAPRVNASAMSVPAETQFGIVEVLAVIKIVRELIERFRRNK